MIARLCPVDYHRYHYPDAGRTLAHYPVHGKFHSVNPAALRYSDAIFATNERYVSILDTENFGKLAYIEVGAMMVGKIVQTHPTDQPFRRGDEKGYFLFGASTVIVLGQPRRVETRFGYPGADRAAARDLYPAGGCDRGPLSRRQKVDAISAQVPFFRQARECARPGFSSLSFGCRWLLRRSCRPRPSLSSAAVPPVSAPMYGPEFTFTHPEILEANAHFAKSEEAIEDLELTPGHDPDELEELAGHSYDLLAIYIAKLEEFRHRQLEKMAAGLPRRRLAESGL